MPWTQQGSAVVVVAHQFNPSVATQLWLVKNGILGEGDLGKGSVFSDFVVQVRSERFNLLITPDQLHFAPKVPKDEEQKMVIDKVGTIVSTLPHTPFKAIGMNFSWLLEPPAGSSVSQITKGLFFRDRSRLYGQFGTDDAEFGAYLSKNILGFRLNLEVKPVQVMEKPGPEKLQFVFNFHKTFDDNAAEQIKACMLQWNEARNVAEQIIEAVRQEGHS